jgi:hypothetical protein
MKKLVPLKLPALRLLCSLTAGALLVSLAACKPTRRETHDVLVGASDVRLTNAAPMQVFLLRLSDDAFYAQRKDDLDQISDVNLRMVVAANRSTRLRIGVHASAERKTRLLETTKIADFNLPAGGLTGAEGQVIRIFNESSLRNLVLGDQFYLYLVAEAEQIDINVARAELIVTAKFLE